MAGNQSFETPLTFELLFLELREPLQALWFECFEALKVDRNDLVTIREKYKKDPKICVIEGIRLWVKTNPSWADLVHVLRYVVMETELADRIEKHYVDPTTVHRPRPLNNSITLEDTQHVFGQPGPQCNSFSYLLTEVLDLFNDGSSSYTLFYIISTLCCPNGSAYIHPDLILSNSTADGILMPLILHSYISDVDIDFLLYVLELLGVSNHLMPAINSYYQQRKLDQPTCRKIRDVRLSCLVCCSLQQNTSVTFKIITAMKDKLKQLFGLENFPYIMQFMGWMNEPLSCYFQLPQACMDNVHKSLEKYPTDLLTINIVSIRLEVGSAIFNYQP